MFHAYSIAYLRELEEYSLTELEKNDILLVLIFEPLLVYLI